MEYIEKNPDDYFNDQRLEKTTNISTPVRQENKLPYDKIGWKDFEYLCAKLARLKYSIARIYLGAGQKQDGIDIFCYEELESKPICIQCKLYIKFSPNDLENAVDEFIKGKWSNEAKEFIVCLRQRTHENEKITEQFILQRQLLLKTKGIELRLWDGLELDCLLREQPNLVYEFFDRGTEPNWVRSFCGEIYAQNFISSVRNIPDRKKYKPVEYYIQRYYKISHSPQLKELSESKRWRLLDLVKEKAFLNTHFLIRSTAGTGKTIDLMYFAGNVLNESLELFPVFIKLKNYTGNDDLSLKTLLNSEINDWQNIPSQKLVILMDGLDEVPEQHSTSIKQLINQLSRELQGSTIIVTTRSNQFQISGNENELEDFHSIRLLPLEKADILQYILDNSFDSSANLYDLIEKTTLIELAETPFYLKHLIDIYNETKSIPQNNKDLFENILRKIGDADRNHYRLNGDSVHYIKKRIRYAEKLAFVMSLMGIRQLKEYTVIDILGEEEVNILKKYFLISCGDSPYFYWEFVHNNFQEYLTARVLSRLPIEKIKELITFKSSATIIKPKWRNILTLLVDSFDKNDTKGQQLIDWLIENQPTALLKVETQNLSPSKRIEIFQRIYNYYKKLGIYPHLSDYSIESLVNFVGESREFVKFLYDEMINSTSEELLLSVYDALTEYQGNLFEYRGLITKKSQEVLKDKFTTFALAKRAIRLAAKYSSNLSELIQFVSDNSKYVDHHEFCNEIYQYLNELNECDDFIDFILDGIEKYEKYITEDNISTLGSGYFLTQCLNKSIKPKSILKMIDVYVERADTISDYRIETNKFFSEEFQRNAAQAFLSEPLIFSRMLDLIEELDKKHLFDTNNQLDITIFFNESGTREQAFEYLYEKLSSRPELNTLYCYFADQKILQALIQKYLDLIVDESAIRKLLIGLSCYSSKELYITFYDELNLKTNNKFVFQPQFDWSAHHKEQTDGDIELLLDREKYIRATQQIFEIIGKQEITLDDTVRIKGRTTYLNNVIKHTIPLRVIRELLKKEEKIDAEKSIQWSEDNDRWKEYVVSWLCSFLNQDISLPEEAIVILKNWVQENLSLVSFTKATYFDKRERLFASIFKRIDVKISQEIMLEMLSFDYSGFSEIPLENQAKTNIRLSDVIIKRVQNDELIKQRIISNLDSDISVSEVIESHLRLCQELKIHSALPSIRRLILKNKVSDYRMMQIIEIFIELGGTYIELLPVVESEYQSQAWHYEFAKKLIDYYPQEICNWIVEGIKTKAYTGEEYLSSYALLIDSGYLEGVEHLTNWIKTNKYLPNRFYLGEFAKQDPFIVLPMLIDSLDVLYANGHTIDAFRSNSSVIGWGFSMVGTNDEKFEYVKNEFWQFITQNKNKYPQVVKLGYTVERQIANYFLAKPEQITLEEATRIARELVTG